MLLALGLVAMMFTLGTVALWGTLGATRREESAARLASLLRAIRAEAASTGRRFRLSLDAETTQPIVSYEPDPLAQPGVFQPYHAWWVEQAKLPEGIRVSSCVRTGLSAYAALEASARGGEDSAEALETLDFDPGGGSDSARIVLVEEDADEEHPWSREILLNGVDGTIRVRPPQPEEADEQFPEAGR